MSETQNIEYKPAWREEFLRWLCGFANVQWGTLFTGKDDAGNVIGVKDSKRLLEDLPNKITTVLGIVADRIVGTWNGKNEKPMYRSQHTDSDIFRKRKRFLDCVQKRN